MNPQLPEPTPATDRTTLLYIDGVGVHLEVDTEALAAFSAHMDASLEKLAARWVAWAPPLAINSTHPSQRHR